MINKYYFICNMSPYKLIFLKKSLDFFTQIISNDEYKSVEHRVLANSSNEPRISVAIFFNPGRRGEADLYGPLQELISTKNPAYYSNSKMSEHVEVFRSNALACNRITNHFKLL